jgi:tRNA pseudouridine55 synthase
VLDKPLGPTSHDVVARVRRALRTREVGHAGTLDPLASGVLVVLVGEATKLAAHLTANDKAYEARVALGRSTTTLDAGGDTVEESACPAAVLRELHALAAGALSHGALAAAPLVTHALDAERARVEQVPPAVSAIHVDGVRAHERVRRGETVALAARPVHVRTLSLRGVGWDGPLPYLDVQVEASKGYYVRALARDLGERLGVPASLLALRRTRSGAFGIDGACSLDGALGERLIPLTELATRALPVARLTAEGVRRARQGQPLSPTHFDGSLPPDPLSAWLSPAGELVALGRPEGDGGRVTRGFAADAVAEADGRGYLR